MNTGIQILIERMKTNPEEFATPQHGGSAKWENIVRDYYEFLEEEDKAAYQQARRELVQGELTEVVMKKLAGVGEDDGVALSSKTLPSSAGSLRINHSTNQYEVFDGKSWRVIDPAQQLNPSNPMYGQQAMAQQQYGAGGGGDGGSMLGQLAKNLGFK